MQHTDPDTHSFVVKLWLEETVEESGQAVWRGRITHVTSGKQYYITELDSIAEVIAPYLQDMQVDLGPRWRTGQWFRRIKLALRRPR